MQVKSTRVPLRPTPESSKLLCTLLFLPWTGFHQVTLVTNLLLIPSPATWANSAHALTAPKNPTVISPASSAECGGGGKKKERLRAGKNEQPRRQTGQILLQRAAGLSGGQGHKGTTQGRIALSRKLRGSARTGDWALTYSLTYSRKELPQTYSPSLL